MGPSYSTEEIDQAQLALLSAIAEKTPDAMRKPAAISLSGDKGHERAQQAVFALIELGSRVEGSLFSKMAGIVFAAETPPVPPQGDPGHLMWHAISNRVFGLIPLLHEAGFKAPTGPFYARQMGNLLGQGLWPHPHLIWPHILEDHESLSELSKHLLSAPKDHWKIQRLVTLPVKPVTLANALSQQFFSLSQRRWPLEAMAEDADTVPNLALLLEHGWLESWRVYDMGPGTGEYTQGVYDLLGQAEDLLLQRKTAAAPISHKQPNRL